MLIGNIPNRQESTDDKFVNIADSSVAIEGFSCYLKEILSANVSMEKYFLLRVS